MDRQATSRIQPTTVVWPDTIDEILAGDCVVMLAYVTHEQHDHRQQRRYGRRGAGLHGPDQLPGLQSGPEPGRLRTGRWPGRHHGRGPEAGAPREGPTQTRALLRGSPAIDAGNPAPPGSGGAACEARDQGGVDRPQDGDGDGVATCDIGAFERGSRPAR